MNDKDDLMFYATILAGILNNRDVGGSTEAKVKMAIDHGNVLKSELQKRKTSKQRRKEQVSERGVING